MKIFLNLSKLPTKAIACSYLAALAIVGIELLGYSGIVSRYLLLSSYQYVFLILILIGVIKLASHRQIDNWLVKTNQCLLILTLGLSIILFGLESYHYTNYVYANFGINYYALVDLLLFTFGMQVIVATQQLRKRNLAIIVFAAFLLSCLYLYFYHFDLFFHLSANLTLDSDDNFMEWLQVGVLGMGIIFAALLAHKARAQKLKLLFYCLIILSLLIFIGEEISWGERLFNLQIEKNSTNYQQELNFHNQPGLNELTAWLYIFAFIYALTSWQAHQYFHQKKGAMTNSANWWDMLCFKGEEVLYFIPTFILNPYAAYTIFPGFPSPLDILNNWGVLPDFNRMLHFLSQWRESFEVLFYAGIVWHLINLFFQNKHDSKSNSFRNC